MTEHANQFLHIFYRAIMFSYLIFYSVKNDLANGCSALTTAQIFCIIFVYYKTCMTAKWLHNPVNYIKKQSIQGLHDIFI